MIKFHSNRAISQIAYRVDSISICVSVNDNGVETTLLLPCLINNCHFLSMSSDFTNSFLILQVPTRETS